LARPAAFVRVALAAPLDKPLTYAWPFSFEPMIGVRVAVPLRGRRAAGFVLGPDEPPQGVKVQSVIEPLDQEPLFPVELMPFFEWLAAYYRHPLGQTLSAALPLASGRKPRGPRLSKAARAVVSAETPALPPGQARLHEFLRGKDWVPFHFLRQLLPGADAAARGLEAKGLIEIDRREAPAAEPELPPEPAPAPEPTPEQAAVLAEIEAAVTSGGYAPFLLHGVTGSGKTEVYIRAGQAALAAGRTALILVPEISLTPRLEALFRARFGDEVAVLHSGLSPGNRFEQWRRLLTGRARVALGARSAVFAPLQRLGLIVVDEEHEPSYKQEDGLRYHARDAALVRARLAGAAVVLGSATPALVSFDHQRRGKYRGLSLPRRIFDRPLPRVEVVDLVEESAGEPGQSIFSQRLIQATGETLAAGQQVIFFLNRRGFATFPVCGKCGRPFVCPNCSVSLTWHAGFGALVCHYCGLARPLGSCPKCGQTEPRLLGLGTERVEAEAARLFPGARLARLDSDVAGGLGRLERTLARLAAGKIDILIGTQMLAKGHDFAGIALVGVILADLSLRLPDFRAAERTFQLLTQVAGRAGRGDHPGQVIIQTLSPDHYSLTTAAAQDYQAFFETELKDRRQLFYPPFARLILLRLSGPDPARVEAAARLLGRLARQAVGRLKSRSRLAVLGPAPAPVIKIKNRYRWRLLLKAQTAAVGQALLDELLALAAGRTELKGIRLKIDVDPMSML